VADRIRGKWPNVLVVHTPVHASRLNQIEVSFSIVERKLPTPSDFHDLAALERALMGFQARHEAVQVDLLRRDLPGSASNIPSAGINQTPGTLAFL
jgi:hypothetical protein